MNGSPSPQANLALLNKQLCKHRYLLLSVYPSYCTHTHIQLRHKEAGSTHTHTQPAGPRPRAKQTVHFMNINTKCTGPPAVQNTKAICEGKDQKHSHRRVSDYTQHVSGKTK